MTGVRETRDEFGINSFSCYVSFSSNDYRTQCNTYSMFGSWANTTRERLLHTIQGCDEHVRCLEELIRRLKKGEGGSAVVYGGKETGRSTVLDGVLTKHVDHSRIPCQTLSLARFGTDASALQELVDCEVDSNPRIIVVDGADDLVCKSRQALLYRLLDRTKNRAWLVFLIVNRQDMTCCLEKRVRSRLSNTRVFMGEWNSMKDFDQMFASILLPDEKNEENNVPESKTPKGKKNRKTEKEINDMDDKEKEMREFLSDFISHTGTKEQLRILYELGGKWSVLKRAIDAWIVLIGVEEENGGTIASLDNAVNAWEVAVSLTLPVHHSLIPIIDGLSKRSFGVLVCVARRLRTVQVMSINHSLSFPYSKIAVDYRHQCNSIDKNMLKKLPPGDIVAFKELDLLCDYGILSTVKTANECLSSKQVIANVSFEVLDNLVKERMKNAIALSEWYKSQPLN